MVQKLGADPMSQLHLSVPPPPPGIWMDRKDTDAVCIWKSQMVSLPPSPVKDLTCPVTWDMPLPASTSSFSWTDGTCTSGHMTLMLGIYQHSPPPCRSLRDPPKG